MSDQLIDLPYAPSVRFHVEDGIGKRAVVRVFFTNNRQERCCIDSRVMGKDAAIRLATSVVRSGGECSVLKWWGNQCRPPDYRVHRVKRLDDVPAAIVDVMAD